MLTPNVPHTPHPLDVRFTDTGQVTIYIRPDTVRSIVGVEDPPHPVTRIQTPQGYHFVPLTVPEVQRILYPTGAQHQRLLDQCHDQKAGI